jgi:hypothetical protein
MREVAASTKYDDRQPVLGYPTSVVAGASSSAGVQPPAQLCAASSRRAG